LKEIRDNSVATLATIAPDSKTLFSYYGMGLSTIWRVGDPESPRVSVPMKPGIDAVEFSPDGNSIFMATRNWGHLARFDGNRLVPVASRMLPFPYPNGSRTAFRFLEPSGERLQIVVQPTGDTVLPTTLRFDTAEDVPIEGDPKTLLKEWEKKLALKIGDDGEIVPAN
jgi:hypothetical protein